MLNRYINSKKYLAITLNELLKSLLNEEVEKPLPFRPRSLYDAVFWLILPNNKELYFGIIWKILNITIYCDKSFMYLKKKKKGSSMRVRVIEFVVSYAIINSVKKESLDAWNFVNMSHGFNLSKIHYSSTKPPSTYAHRGLVIRGRKYGILSLNIWYHKPCWGSIERASCSINSTQEFLSTIQLSWWRSS